MIHNGLLKTMSKLVYKIELKIFGKVRFDYITPNTLVWLQVLENFRNFAFFKTGKTFQ